MRPASKPKTHDPRPTTHNTNKMKILKNLNSLSRAHLKSPVLTWGIFDGVHRGHQTLIKEVVQLARQKRVDSLALTFQEHPKKVLRSHDGALFITSLEHRLLLLERLGVTACLVLPFDRRFSRLSPESFIRLVYEQIKPSVIVVTPGIIFGRDRSGNLPLLRTICNWYGIKVQTVNLLGNISSTRIRAAIQDGQLAKAGRMLGRPVSILGTVVRGSQRGRQIGFPTANLDPHHEILPPGGVYAGRVYFAPMTVGATKTECRTNGRIYRAVVNIGTRPTFEKSKSVIIEVHLLGYHGHERLYGKNIEVEIVRRLRPEIRFATCAQLVAQIKKDIKQANTYI